MIQRIQSIYLFLAAMSTGIGMSAFSLYTFDELTVWLIDDPTFLAMAAVSVLLSLIAIFRFKNRQQQVVISRLNIILNFVIFGLLLYMFFTTKPGMESSNLGIASYIPILTVIFLSLANRAIMRDELLIRAADRLR